MNTSIFFYQLILFPLEFSSWQLGSLKTLFREISLNEWSWNLSWAYWVYLCVLSQLLSHVWQFYNVVQTCIAVVCDVSETCGLAPHPDALHAAQEGADGALFGFGSQELCVSVGELDVSQLPPAVQTRGQQLPETQSHQTITFIRICIHILTSGLWFTLTIKMLLCFVVL